MKKQFVVYSFKIERRKQVKMFQIRLPRETKSVIGIGTGFQRIEGIPDRIFPPRLEWKMPMQMDRNFVFGEVRLQSCEKANICYTAELIKDENLDYADFSSRWWKPKDYTHQYNLNMDDVIVKGETTVLEGIYKDKLFEQQQDDYKYKVNVYVLVETKEL